MGKRKVLSEANLSEMLTPGPGQMYGTVKNLLGYDRVLVECADGVTRVCRIRGKMKRNNLSREPFGTSFNEGSPVSTQCLGDSRRILQYSIRPRELEDVQWA